LLCKSKGVLTREAIEKATGNSLPETLMDMVVSADEAARTMEGLEAGIDDLIKELSVMRGRGSC